MKHFYEDGKKRWDHWNAFHCHTGSFTQFDTGEVICNSGNFSKDNRHLYSKVNVSVFDQTDHGMPQVYMPDLTPIKTAWFGDLQRTFLIDHDHGVVHEIKNILYKDHMQPDWVKAHVPKRLWGKCSVYWPSPQQRPYGPPIKLRKPRKMTDAERDHLAGIRAAIKAEEVMTESEFGFKGYHENKDPVKAEDLFKLQWSEVTVGLKNRIKSYGVLTPTEEIVLPYLVVQIPPEEHGDV